MRGSYVSLRARGWRFLAAQIPLYQNSFYVSLNPGPGGTPPNTNLSQGPRFPFKAKALPCCHLNVRSLPVHLNEVGTLILLNNLDVFAVSKTWFNSTWNNHGLNIQGYQLFQQDRETTVASRAPHGGGVAIDAKSTLHCQRMTFSNELHMEHICLQLRQHKDVTKNSAMLIDHVYTTHPNRIVEIIVPTHGMNDHYPVCFVHKYRGIRFGKFSHDEISYRNFKILNHNEFVADLDNAPWSLLNMFDDVNEKLDTWEWIFNNVMNRHTPIVKKRVKHKPLLPWMNNDILLLMYHRDQFKARAKSNILAGIMYKRLRNQVVKTIAKAKTDYVSNEIS